MKCKIIFETKTVVPTFEDFRKSMYECEACSINMVIEKACQMALKSIVKGYLLTPADQCYRFEYDKTTASIITDAIGELKPKVPLTFETLRKANIQRLPEFKNSKGKPAHSKSDGSDWSPEKWLGALIGELGEYANVMKKVDRGDLTAEEAKPLIEKELSDVMTYLDILAFRVDVDLSKAVEQKFNEVSERVGCSLRIENNEVVRKETEKSYCGTGQLIVDSKNCPAFIQIPSGINTSILENYDYNSKNGEFTPKLTKVVKETQENSNRMEKYKSSAKQIASNWIGTSKISNTTRAKIEDLIEKDILDIKKSIDSESGKVSDIELIVNAALMGVKFGDAAKLKVDLLIKNDLEEFKKAVDACRIPRQEFAERQRQKPNNFIYTDLFRQMYHQEWVEQCKQYAYPLYAERNEITDIYGFEFQNLDTLKQLYFYQVKEMVFENDCIRYRYPVKQSLIFDYFSKQLGTKIVGMLINGSKENTKLNSGDMIQFYDDRNILWNFRLVKASEKNVEIAMS